MSSRRRRAHLASRRSVLAAAALTSLMALTALAGGCSSAGSSTASAVRSGPAASAGHYPSATAGHSSSPSARHSASAAQATLAPARRAALADRYRAVAVPANHRLDHEVEGFADHQRSDLAAAEADLRAEAATERGFDRRLAAIPFRPGIAAMARALIQANQSRVALTDRQAPSASLTRLNSFAAQRLAADAAVEFGARLIRRALALPPPSES